MSVHPTFLFPVLSEDYLRNYREASPDDRKSVESRLQNQLSFCIKQMEAQTPDEHFKLTYCWDPLAALTAGLQSSAARINGYFFNLFGGRSIGICHSEGRRDSMEDQHIATSFTFTAGGQSYPAELYGIFDGHGGTGAAEFLKENLKNKLQSQLKKYNQSELTDTGIWNALKLTFPLLHNELKTITTTDGNGNIIQESSGSTATVALIIDGHLWTANVGDSRTILVQNNTDQEVIQLSEDAKPNDERYKKGIQKRGGDIQRDPNFSDREVFRINGHLAVGRAIGDHQQKPELGLNPRPKITKIPLDSIPKNSLLILGCDGIYDVASSKQVGDVLDFANQRALSVREIAKTIVYSAYKAGSEDNLSAMVLKVGNQPL